MPEQEPNNSTNAALSEREIVLKEREIALKEQETKAKIELDKRGYGFLHHCLLGCFQQFLVYLVQELEQLFKATQVYS